MENRKGGQKELPSCFFLLSAFSFLPASPFFPAPFRFFLPSCFFSRPGGVWEGLVRVGRESNREKHVKGAFEGGANGYTLINQDESEVMQPTGSTIPQHQGGGACWMKGGYVMGYMP